MSEVYGLGHPGGSLSPLGYRRMIATAIAEAVAAWMEATTPSHEQEEGDVGVRWAGPLLCTKGPGDQVRFFLFFNHFLLLF